MSNEFFALDAEGGDPIWYLQILMTIKASGDKTGGALGLLDFKTPAGQTPLRRSHSQFTSRSPTHPARNQAGT